MWVESRPKPGDFKLVWAPEKCLGRGVLFHGFNYIIGNGIYEITISEILFPYKRYLVNICHFMEYFLKN